MDRKQITLLLAKAAASYPNSAPNFKERPNLFEPWAEMLASFDGETALRNLNRHISSSSFFPTIADIMRQEPNSTTHGEFLLLEAAERLSQLEQWERDAVDPPEKLLHRKRGGPV